MATVGTQHKSCILYQNDSLDVFVIDLPASFASAQDSSPTVGSVPYAGEPLIEVFLSTEPRHRTKPLVIKTEANEDTHLTRLSHALNQAHAGCRGQWCLSRQVWDEGTLIQKKRRDEALVRSLQSNASSWRASPPLHLTPMKTSVGSLDHLQDRLTCNDNPHTTTVQVKNPPTSFLIPPSSRFLLSHIDENTAPTFSMSALQTVSSGRFDLVLLDPPWPNRSVRRSRQYQMSDVDENPLVVLESLMGMHLAPGCFVACWVTNKLAVRQAALGLFDTWNLVLCEQWTWLKVTAGGQPVTTLDGVWRKPYEMLFIACSRDSDHETITKSVEVINRVLISVPDLHSRKPSLKELVELLLFPNGKKYSALEVFARHLTTNWFSW